MSKKAFEKIKSGLQEVLESVHTGPVCKRCGAKFYYDYIPERHDGSGYCWLCFDAASAPPHPSSP